jgi:non-heme chloroperoxidase
MTGNTRSSISFFVALTAALLLGACTDTEQQVTRSADQVDLKSISVNDTTLHYIERGQGTPVVFVHGALGDYRTWDGQIEAFSEQYRAISYSRRYHYPNDYPQDTAVFPRPDDVADLKSFIEALDIRPVHLVGHSRGGAIALEFARDYPDYLVSLTLGEPGARNLLTATTEGEAALRSFAESVSNPAFAALQAGKDEEAVRLFIDGVQGQVNGFANLPQKFREGMLQNVHTMRSSRLTEDPRPRSRLTCEEAGQIRIPTFLIHGELSPAQFVLTNEMLGKCMPNVERAMLPSVSHSLAMENPGDFNEMVLEYIERLDNVWEPFAGALENTQRRNLTSEITGRTYQISVALPRNYATSNETFPVLYAVDANIQFGTVVETARLLHRDKNMNTVPELIIIGIGSPVHGAGLRTVSLTPTEDSGLAPIKDSGGAPGFLNFIRRELIPLVELEFRANSEGRALYGHSLGGLFGLYALLEGEGTFQRVIAGSPSIGWDDRVILETESAYAEDHDFLPAQLFLSSGFLEDNQEFGESVADVKELVAILEARNYSGLQIKTAYFEDETHISVIPATISRGLRSVYELIPNPGSE